MKSLTYFLGIFAFITNACDLITTITALSFGAIELNPLLAEVGYTLFVLIKIIFPTLVIFFFLIMAKKKESWRIGSNIGLGLLGLIFLFAVINNLIVISHLI